MLRSYWLLDMPKILGSRQPDEERLDEKCTEMARIDSRESMIAWVYTARSCRKITYCTLPRRDAGKVSAYRSGRDWILCDFLFERLLFTCISGTCILLQHQYKHPKCFLESSHPHLVREWLLLILPNMETPNTRSIRLAHIDTFRPFRPLSWILLTVLTEQAVIYSGSVRLVLFS